MKYSRDEAKFLLENYKNIKFECDDFLLNSYQPGDKSEVSNQKTGRENERNLIKKLDDKQYQENKRILKCIDKYMKNLDVETYRIVYAKYFSRMKNYDIATKYHMHISTVKRRLSSQLDIFLKLINTD
nr:MAG TPA: Protein of unknown function (DUF722) [Caudoviricetes sp.]